MKLVPERSLLPRLLAILYLVIAVAGALALILWPEAIVRWAHCPWRKMTGWPCLTCGGTHAAVAMVQLRLADAVRANPFVVLASVVFAGWAGWAVVATLLPSLRRELVLSRRDKRVLRVGVLAFLLGGWLYLIFDLGAR